MSQQLKPSEITPEDVYKNRRLFMRAGLVAATGAATAGVYRYFNPTVVPEPLASSEPIQTVVSPSPSATTGALADKPNTFGDVTG